MPLKQQLLGSLGLIALCSPSLYAAPEPTPTCPAANRIAKSFASGASWSLCAEIRPNEGLTLTQVYYAAPNKQPRRVLGEASLSQIEILTDTASTPNYVVTQQGLGKNIIPLAKTDCPQGTLKSLSGNSICRSAQDYGYQYKYDSQRQGRFFELLTNYSISPRSYSLRWRFYENGIIEPALGISGQLTHSSPKNMENFTAHLGWRLDFDLGTTGSDDEILEVTSTPSEDRLTKTVQILNQNKEYGVTENPEIKRFWVVRDGNTPYEGINVPAYDIVPNNYNYSRINNLSEAWLQKDIYFSKYNSCERYAVDNLLSACPSRINSTARFIANKESIADADSVVWYRQSYHHLARSDDGLRLATVWNSFQLIPRDWHSQNQF